MMAENLLSDARVRSASFERDGHYLPDGGGLRIRLLKPSSNHAKGARLAEFHFKLRQQAGDYKNGALHLGTIGDQFTDGAGKMRPFALKDAREARDAARELVSKGIDPREAARLADAEQAEAQRQRLAELDTRRTVQQAFDRWATLYLAKNRKDGGQFVQQMFDRHVLPVLGELPLETLRRGQITDLLDGILAKGLRRTANMTLSTIRQFVRWCAERDWITNDPTLNLSKGRFGGKEDARQRVLSALEIVSLRDKLPTALLPERIVHALWLILATGCRVGELSGARATDFDLTAKTWLIPDTKNGSEHLVHLSEFALGHIATLFDLRGGSEYLLPGRTTDDGEDRPISDKVITKLVGDRQREAPLKGRSKAVTALLLPRGKWTPHDLRRTMATRMRGDLQVSRDVVERCLNHKPDGIVGVYQTDELLAERKAAFEAWGLELQRLQTVDVSNVAELPARAA